MKVIQNYILTLNFGKEKNYKHLRNTLIYKAKQFMLKFFCLKSLHNLEGSGSSVQVGILNM